MEIVIDTVDDRGQCRAMIVEAIKCDGNTLTVRRGGKTLEIPIFSIVDWSAIEEQVPAPLPLERWIPRRADVVCF